MKKSVQITLTVVATVGLASCSRRHPDPCISATFNQQACQEAIDHGGYYWHGSWYPVRYSNPYPYYYDSYRSYVSKGGKVVSEPTTSYSNSKYASGSGSSRSSSSSGVTRGGFGSTGSGHSSSGS